MIKTKLFVLIFLLYVSKVQSQITNGLGFQIGYAFQKISRVDLGINYLFVKKKKYVVETRTQATDSIPKFISSSSKYSLRSSGLNFSLHGFFHQQKFVLGESFGYTYGKVWNKGLGFNSGLNIFYFGSKDFRISPSIGISILEIIHVNYSYLLPIQKEYISLIGNHQVNLTIRINRALNESLLNIVR